MRAMTACFVGLYICVSAAQTGDGLHWVESSTVKVAVSEAQKGAVTRVVTKNGYELGPDAVKDAISLFKFFFAKDTSLPTNTVAYAAERAEKVTFTDVPGGVEIVYSQFPAEVPASRAVCRITSGGKGDKRVRFRMDVDVSKAKSFGIDLLKGGKWDATTYTYDVENALIQGRTENKGESAKAKAVSGALPNDDDILSFEIYVDRSLVEAFFEDYKAISIRSYPENKDSKAIDLFAEGDVQIVTLYVATMESIFD